MELNELKKLNKSERSELFREFLRVNVLPSLRKNEEKLDELYEQAKVINEGED